MTTFVTGGLAAVVIMMGTNATTAAEKRAVRFDQSALVATDISAAYRNYRGYRPYRYYGYRRAYYRPYGGYYAPRYYRPASYYYPYSYPAYYARPHYYGPLYRPFIGVGYPFGLGFGLGFGW